MAHTQALPHAPPSTTRESPIPQKTRTKSPSTFPHNRRGSSHNNYGTVLTIEYPPNRGNHPGNQSPNMPPAATRHDATPRKHGNQPATPPQGHQQP